MRGLLLWMVAMMVLGGSALARTVPEHVEAAEPVANTHHEIIIPHTPTPAPERPDFDLYGLEIVTGSQETHEDATVSTEEAAAEEVPAEPEYLGEWTITAYCSCPICCGEYATGFTASGTLAAEGRTIACNALPIGAEVLIDGNTYTVEDTGYTPYGDAWIDIYFDSHEAALAWGVQTKEVYLID